VHIIAHSMGNRAYRRRRLARVMGERVSSSRRALIPSTQVSSARTCWGLDTPTSPISAQCWMTFTMCFSRLFRQAAALA